MPVRRLPLVRSLALLAAAFIAALAVACTDDEPDEPAAPPEPTTATQQTAPATATQTAAATATATATATAAATATATATPTPRPDPTTLVVITHDSFDVSEGLIEAFEEASNARVELIAGGDANEVVNRAILNAGNPEGDVLFGVDNLSYSRAVAVGVFEEYEAARHGDIPADIRAQFGDSLLVTPVDYGFVNLNFDPAAGDPPETLEELTEPQWRGKLVVEDPATSSPGLQFLATTVAYFGEGRWQEFWRGLRANDVRVELGWSDAYYSQFSVYGGDRPLVVSYTSSPAAEFFFSEEELTEPPTRNVIPSPLFRQVEAVGILRGTEHPELAAKFIDFMLSDAFQQQIPETMFVYPVIPDLDLPEWWDWANVEVETASLEFTADDIDRWIREWTEIMRR